MEYTKVRNQAKSEIRKVKKEFAQEIARNSKVNPKYVNSKSNTRSGIPNLMKEDGTTMQNDKEKAEELNTFFANGFAKENLADLPFFEARHNDVILEKIGICEQDEILANLNPSKSPGPDGIHPRILLTRLSVGIGKKLFGINGCIHDNQSVLQIVITMVDNPQIFPFIEQKFCPSDI
eukprot:gene2244-2560_t